MKYTDHKHVWQPNYITSGIYSIGCIVCDLQVMGLSDRVTLVDFTRPLGKSFLGHLLYPDPEDEEDTKLEPEEVTVDAEGGEV